MRKPSFLLIDGDFNIKENTSEGKSLLWVVFFQFGLIILAKNIFLKSEILMLLVLVIVKFLPQTFFECIVYHN